MRYCWTLTLENDEYGVQRVILFFQTYNLFLKNRHSIVPSQRGLCNTQCIHSLVWTRPYKRRLLLRNSCQEGFLLSLSHTKSSLHFSLKGDCWNLSQKQASSWDTRNADVLFAVPETLLFFSYRDCGTVIIPGDKHTKTRGEFWPI